VAMCGCNGRGGGGIGDDDVCVQGNKQGYLEGYFERMATNRVEGSCIFKEKNSVVGDYQAQHDTRQTKGNCKHTRVVGGHGCTHACLRRVHAQGPGTSDPRRLALWNVLAARRDGDVELAFKLPPPPPPPPSA